MSIEDKMIDIANGDVKVPRPVLNILVSDVKGEIRQEQIAALGKLVARDFPVEPVAEIP